jgi:hypothetical protein
MNGTSVYSCTQDPHIAPQIRTDLYRTVFLTDASRFLGLVREFNLVPPEFLVINWENRPTRSSSHPSSMSPSTDSQPPTTTSGDSLTPAENDALTRSPLGSRKRTDTMYFSGDFNVLDPALGIGSLGEGDGLPLEVPKVPSEGQEEGDEWVLPERAYSDHEGAGGISHEHEDEGIPVEVTVEQDVAPEVDEKSAEEPRAAPSEEDPFADYSADISAAEVEAQLEVSIEEPAEGEETTETVVDADAIADEALAEKVQVPVQTSEVEGAEVEGAEVEGTEVAEVEVAEVEVAKVEGAEVDMAVDTAEAVVPKPDVSGEDVIEQQEKKD